MTDREFSERLDLIQEKLDRIDLSLDLFVFLLGISALMVLIVMSAGS